MAAEDDGFDTITGGEEAEADDVESIDFDSPVYDDAKESESEGEEERSTRKERRRERGEMHKALQQTREENQKMREQLARLEGFVSQATQPQGPPFDPMRTYQEAQNKIYDRVAALQEQERAEMQSEARAGRNRLPPERVQYYRQEAAKLDLERAHVQQQALSAMQAPNQQMQGRLQFLQVRYPDIMSRKDLFEYADGYVRQQVAKGRTNDVALVDEGVEAARREFRIGQYAKSAPVDRHMRESRLSLPRGGVPGPEAMPTTVRMGRAEKSLAEGLYPDDKPEKAWSKWAKNVGSKLPSRRHG